MIARRFVPYLLSVPLALTTASAANGTVIGGRAGYQSGYGGSSPPCFTESWGGAYNASCASPVLVVEMPTSTAGAGNASQYTGTITVAGGGPNASSTNISCAADSLDATGLMQSWTGWQSAPSYYTWSIALPSLLVPSQGYAFTNCYVPPGVTVASVAWNEGTSGN